MEKVFFRKEVINMDKYKAKKTLIISLTAAGLTFGVFTINPITVQATNEAYAVEYELPYEDFRLLKKYTNIFCIDYDFAKATLYNYLDDKTDFKVINGVKYRDEEVALLTFVYQLAYKPKELGLTKNDIVRDVTEYDMQFSHEEFIYYYANILNIDPDVALSISYAECGTDMGSTNWKKNNNPAGLGPFMKFDNKAQGDLYYLFLLKRSYNLSRIADDEFFNKIAKTYCPGNPDHWIGLTKGIYSNVSTDYFYYNHLLQDNYEDYRCENEDEVQYQIIQRMNEYMGTESPRTGLKTIKKIKSVN